MGTAYTQRSITEPWRHTKVPVDEMARVLRPCRSTIYRELKRNNFSDESMPKHDGYFGAAAQLVTADRRARDRKLIEHPELCRRVIEQINDGSFSADLRCPSPVRQWDTRADQHPVSSG